MEVNFLNYVTSLAFQSLIFMGEKPNPVDNKMGKNLKQAKLLLDTLMLIQKKTVGNLSGEEVSFLKTTVDDLTTKYKEILKAEERNNG